MAIEPGTTDDTAPKPAPRPAGKVMEAARRAAEVVATWSPSKRDFARRACRSRQA